MKFIEYVRQRGEHAFRTTRDREIKVDAPAAQYAALLTEAGFHFTLEYIWRESYYSLSCSNNTGPLAVECFDPEFPIPSMAAWLAERAHEEWVELGMPKAADFDADAEQSR